MLKDWRTAIFLFGSMLMSAAVAAQQSHPAKQAAQDRIYLDVVVTHKSGPPISGLQQQDFTVLDNKVQQSIDTFRALSGKEEPIEVVLVIDDVNTGIEHVAFERTEVDKLLQANGGHLAHPTALAFLTDEGLRVQNDFSRDGNAMSQEMNAYPIGLHTVLRSGGYWSATERFDLSLNALLQLANREAARPGRKMILWISPGWPLLSTPGVEAQMDSLQQQQIFTNVVKVANLMREGRITLYSIDPLGTVEPPERAYYWEEFVKGINKPGDAQYGNLALQVFAAQSGGLALTAGNDITAFLQRCLADSEAYYEISYIPTLGDARGPYHHVEVRVAKSGLAARARQGYYAQN
jgi:VWFA-related protein